MHDICLGKSKEPFGALPKKSDMKNESEKTKWMNERMEKGYSFRYCKNSDRLNVSVLCVETEEEFYFDWEDSVLKNAKNIAQQQLYDANAQSGNADCV